MSSQYISALVIILATLLPKFGIQVGSDELTSFLQAVITVVGGVVIMYKRYKQGGINILGRKRYYCGQK